MITNYLSPLEFIVTVKRLPHVQFFTQRTSIPAISLQPVDTPTPFKTIYETGSVSYSELNLSFIVDENMSNYIEVFNWIRGIGFPQNFDQYKNVKNREGIRSDISIVVMNSHKNPNIEINFIDCFPTSLSEVVLDTTQTDLVYPEATVSFQYNSYNINVINK